jgi:hypothetical protein
MILSPEPKRRRLVVQDLRDHLPDDIIGLIVQERVRRAREFNRRSHAARLLQHRWLYQNHMRWVAWDQQMQEEEEEDRAVLFLQQFWRLGHRPQPVTLPMLAMGYPVFTGLALGSLVHTAIEFLSRFQAWPITSYRRYE